MKVDKVTLEIAVKYDETRQEIAKLNKDIEEENRILKETKVAKQKAMKKYKDESHPEVLKATKAYEDQQKKIDSLKARRDQLQRSLKVEGLSIAELREEIKKYDLQMRNLTPGTEKFNETKQHLDELKGRLRELQTGTDQTKGSLMKFLGGFNQFGFAFTNLKEIVSTVWNGIKTAAIEWYNYNKQMAEATRLTREFLHINGNDLGAMVAGIKATADVWEKDYKEILEGVDTLTSIYHQNAVQSLRDIQDGLQSGADLNGDMIQKIKQYGPAFRDAGIGAREMVAIIQQTRSGIFSDRGLDLISMAAKRIREMEKSTRESLQAVGIDAGQLLQDVENGTITMFGAIQRVSGALKGVGENSIEAGAVLKDVFGRQGAAGGQEMIKSLEEMDTDLSNLMQTTGEYGQLQARQVELQTELNKKTQALFTMTDGGFDRMIASMKEIGTKLLIKIIDGLIKTVNYVIDLYNSSATVRTSWLAVKDTFLFLFAVLKAGFSAVGNAISGIIGLTSGAVTALEGMLTLDFTKAKHGLQMFGRAIGDFVKDTWKDIEAAGNKWGSTVNNDIREFNRKVEPIKIPVTTIADVDSIVGDDSIPEDKKKKTSVPSAAVSQQPDAYRQQLAAREQAYREYGNSLRQMLLHNYITEEEYRQESLEAELKFLSDKAALQQQYGEDVTDTQRQYLDRMLQEATRRHQQEQQLLKQQQDQERRELERNRLSQEGNNEYLQKVEWQGQSFDRMRQLNDEYLRQNLISYQQYQDNLTKIAQEQETQRTQIQQAATDATQQLLQSATSFFSAMQSRETAEVDAKYKRMIAAAKKQGKDTAKLEQQQETERAAIAKKYADRNFKMQVLQIIGNTAQGISKTIAELGMPWAVPFVAMAAAAGAMQLASAKAAAEQAAGLYEGGYSEGYTKKGNPRRQAGVIPVHQNEFVANHHAVANPAVRPVLDVIDRHQRIGDIRMLNATRLLEEAYGPGRYRGGYTHPATVPDGSPSGLSATIADQILPVLTRIEQNTASSLTVRSLRDEIRHEERLEQNARR